MYLSERWGPMGCEGAEQHVPVGEVGSDGV
jgi:hypothetical protein